MTPSASSTHRKKVHCVNWGKSLSVFLKELSIAGEKVSRLVEEELIYNISVIHKPIETCTSTVFSNDPGAVSEGIR